MHIGKFVFAQITEFLPQRQFRRIVAKFNDRTMGWSMSHWSHMLVLIFGQLMGCGSLRELTDITIAHGRKSKHLGFGSQPVNRQILSKANNLRDYRIFEEFAFYMVGMAQFRRLTKEFELHGKFMLSTLQPSTCACPFSNGLNSEVPSLASEYIRRLTLQPRFLCSIGLPMPKCMMSTLWSGSHTNCWHAMSLTEATLIFPDYT